jgi:hypothetical protein
MFIFRSFCPWIVALVNAGLKHENRSVVFQNHSIGAWFDGASADNRLAFT